MTLNKQVHNDHVHSTPARSLMGRYRHELGAGVACDKFLHEIGKVFAGEEFHHHDICEGLAYASEALARALIAARPRYWDIGVSVSQPRNSKSCMVLQRQNDVHDVCEGVAAAETHHHDTKALQL